MWRSRDGDQCETNIQVTAFEIAFSTEKKRRKNGPIWRGIVLLYTLIKEDMKKNVTFEQNSKASEVFMVIKMAVLKR